MVKLFIIGNSLLFKAYSPENPMGYSLTPFILHLTVNFADN